jgi:hypothetical protein
MAATGEKAKGLFCGVQYPISEAPDSQKTCERSIFTPNKAVIKMGLKGITHKFADAVGSVPATKGKMGNLIVATSGTSGTSRCCALMRDPEDDEFGRPDNSQSNLDDQPPILDILCCHCLA